LTVTNGNPQPGSKVGLLQHEAAGTDSIILQRIMAVTSYVQYLLLPQL